MCTFTNNYINNKKRKNKHTINIEAKGPGNFQNSRCSLLLKVIYILQSIIALLLFEIIVFYFFSSFLSLLLFYVVFLRLLLLLLIWLSSSSSYYYYYYYIFKFMMSFASATQLRLRVNTYDDICRTHIICPPSLYH